jgi:hypothetical protein
MVVVMAGFTKLFSSIVTSTIWCEDNATLRVWIAMLAMSDAHGRVEGAIPGFANLARVSIEEMRQAVKILSSPDPDSRTPENEGRRIVVVDGGWWILNYKKFRESRQDQDGSRAAYMREYRKQTSLTPVTQTVTRNTEAEAEAEALKPKTVPPLPPQDSNEPYGWPTFWASYPRKTAKQAAWKAYKRLNPSPELFEAMLRALAAQCKQDGWVRDAGQFIPHASTWLNGKRWEDQVGPSGKVAPKPGEPGYVVTDVDRVIAAYRNAKKIPKDDEQWRTIMWERQKKDAQALLDYFAGDWRSAVDCVSATAEKCEGLDWGWKAVMGRAPEVKNQYGGER